MNKEGIINLAKELYKINWIAIQADSVEESEKLKWIIAQIEKLGMKPAIRFLLEVLEVTQILHGKPKMKEEDSPFKDMDDFQYINLNGWDCSDYGDTVDTGQEMFNWCVEKNGSFVQFIKDLKVKGYKIDEVIPFSYTNDNIIFHAIILATKVKNNTITEEKWNEIFKKLGFKYQNDQTTWVYFRKAVEEVIGVESKVKIG